MDIRENTVPAANERNLLPTTVNPYHGLRDIDDTPGPSQEERSQLERLAAFMKREGMTARFGITLLHKHFEVEDDEMLVESCDPENRTLTIQSMKKEELAKVAGGYKQTQWRYDGANGNLACVLLCSNVGQGHNISHAPK